MAKDKFTVVLLRPDYMTSDTPYGQDIYVALIEADDCNHAVQAARQEVFEEDKAYLWLVRGCLRLHHRKGTGMKKPFDLEAAKRGEPLITRDGCKARFIAHVPEAACDFQLIVYVAGAKAAFLYFIDGRYKSADEDIRDLFMDVPEPKKVTMYQALFKESHSLYWIGARLFTDALEARGSDRRFVRLLTEYPIEVEVQE